MSVLKNHFIPIPENLNSHELVQDASNLPFLVTAYKDLGLSVTNLKLANNDQICNDRVFGV